MPQLTGDDASFASALLGLRLASRSPDLRDSTPVTQVAIPRPSGCRSRLQYGRMARSSQVTERGRMSE